MRTDDFVAGTSDSIRLVPKKIYSLLIPQFALDLRITVEDNSDDSTGCAMPDTSANLLTTNLPTALAGFEPDSRSKHSLTVQKALHLARILQERASHLQTPHEAQQQEELDRMIHHPHDKATLTQITDQAFRAHNPDRAIEQLIHILDVQGIPGFFSPIDHALLKGLQTFGSYLPSVAATLVKDKMQHETANVILPAEEEILRRHLRARRKAGLRMNLNLLGEALLGEKEARRRLQNYLQTLQIQETEVISVKISTIYSQINPMARKHTIDVLCQRMELLYRAAARERFVREDGTEVPKFVYLDMEEYRDMSLTAEVFMQTLDRPGQKNINAGIALQAYIPDSFATQKRINAWARQRVAAGGSPVTIRIVKGANLEMERVEASVMGWPQAPFKRKAQTDANYKRMLQEGMKPENINAVCLGIASHNLFDLSYGLILAEELNASNKVQFEMLEGMANHQRRALFELSRNVLLYTPACRKENFIHAIGYLVRRLDENTGQDNFLRHAFRIGVDSDEWHRLEKDFTDSFREKDGLSEEPRRTQNRRRESPQTPEPSEHFVNESDTDFSLPGNSVWAEEIVAKAKARASTTAEIPVVITGEEFFTSSTRARESFDPSRPHQVVAICSQASVEQIHRAVDCAKQDKHGWCSLDAESRGKILRNAANELRKARGHLMASAILEGGKILAESDPEVSEAIDFFEYYSARAQELHEIIDLDMQPGGVVAVVTPWNFPIAIPCGGIAAALAAGNNVLLKPASETTLIAYDICKCLWDAGVPREALQFLPCSGSKVAPELVSHPDVDAVILTGGTDTARAMLHRSPSMNLLAETGGKNATIVTALADRDLAIKNVLHSAFSHSGQKCSATSLLILEGEVYDDPEFREALIDAASSMAVGSAFELHTKIGPLIRPPSGDLEKGLKELERGETWALLPEPQRDNPQLWSPGIKWNVKPGSYTHMTEFFGPLLGVMRAETLEEAIEFVNQTGYGLTSGLESLDDREKNIWTSKVRAGNLYINRPTTGAVVHRQPFGGMGKSAFGPGIKAGGPNYVTQFASFKESGSPFHDEQMSNIIENPDLHRLHWELHALVRTPNEFPPQELKRTLAAIASYDIHYRQEIALEHDDFRLIGQDNIRRYLALPTIRIRVHPDDSMFDLFGRISAARVIGSKIVLSCNPAEVQSDERLARTLDFIEVKLQSWETKIIHKSETDESLAQAIGLGLSDRIRYGGRQRVPRVVREAAAKAGIFIANADVLPQGRIELMWYVQEQSISHNYHRYGNLGFRAEEERAAVK